MTKTLDFIKHNPVLLAAIAAAAVTAFFVPPDAAYAGYFDLRTLTCLFCTSAVVAALSGIGFFRILSHKIVRCFKTLRMSVLALVVITFVGSMVIANDMALITFLPLGYHVLESGGAKHYMAYTFILQNIAANLGGMLTPFGNPQNLYIYSKFSLSAGEFMQTMLPPFILAVLMITVCCLLLPASPLELVSEIEKLPARRSAIYLAMFALAVSVVFRATPYLAGLVLILVALLVCDRMALTRVDYPLLLTFVAFFVFSGNLARLEPVRAFFGSLLERGVLLVSAISCQFISNVPSAVLLSQFTGSWRELLVGVNIGGTGTIIASLASLITFREFCKREPGKSRRYLALFFVMNFVFLAVMLAFESVVM